MEKSLETYIKENPTKTLEEVQQYPLTTYRVFNSNEMTMYLLRCDLLDYVLDQTSGILRAFAIRVLSVSRFDFCDNSDDGISNKSTLTYIINSITNDEPLKSKFSALLSILVNDANMISYPFGKTTQEEFDVASVEHTLFGEQVATSISYMGGNDKHVKVANEDVRLTVRLDTPVVVDTTVDFTLLIRNTDEQEFSPVQNWSFQITVPKGSTTTTREITNTRKLTRHTQFVAKSNVLNTFTVEVTGA